MFAKPSPAAQSRQGVALIVLANSLHRLGQWPEAEEAFRAAIDKAQERKGWTDKALFLDHYGLALLERGDLKAAEPRLAEAAELRRRQAPKSLGMSERSLGRLRLAQGRHADALVLIDSALGRQRQGLQITPIFNLYGDRTRAHHGLGRVAEALADYREAMRYVRRWRLDLLPAAGLQATREADLHRLRSGYVQLAAAEAERTGDRRLAVESLLGAEESRASALREDVRIQRIQLPPAYAEQALQLQQIESALLSAGVKDPAALRAWARQLESQLIEIETAAGLESQTAATAALDSLPQPRADEVRFSFFLDRDASWRWEILGGRVTVKRLPGEAALTAMIERFREGIPNGAAANSGAQLYYQIFGEISPMSATKPLWSIVPDGPLFAVPFAALPVRAADAYSRYLIEDHAVRTLPSVLLPPSGAEEIEGGFVAVGDPVYNRADSRWRGSAQPGLQLPRLAASGVEAENVARAWPAQTEVLRGAAATRTRFLATLARRPAILHLALHFVESEDRRQTFLALGRGPDSQQSERLGPETIRTLTGAPALVVMNGCESGRGPVLSGAGLMGLTRAWLAAGAREVAASHWPVRDDSGEIFVRLYHHLQTPSGATASLALRQAQLEMIRAADWRREPRYWSAFFVVSKG